MIRGPNSLWLIQTAFLGDAVLTLPLILRLSQSFPDTKITIVCSPQNRGIFECALKRGLKGQSSQLVLRTFDKRSQQKGFAKMLSWVAEHKKHGAPEWVFCVQRSFRTGLLAILTGAKRRVGFSTGAADFLYTDLVRRSWFEGRHEIHKNLDLLKAILPEKAIGFDELLQWDAAKAPSLLSAQERVPGQPRKSRTSSNGPLLSLSLGSPWLSKRWPLRHCVELLRGLLAEGVAVRLLGDSSMLAWAEEIKKHCAHSHLIDDLVGKSTVEQWIDAIDDSDLLISNDSASVHIASDLAVPTIALFGPTVPEFGFAPFRPHSIVLGLAHLSCRPCHIHGPKRCPLAHHRCMEELSPSLVLNHALSALQVTVRNEKA